MTWTWKYKRIRINKKTVLEHRYVMEQKLGRPLLPTEIVHHINGDQQDNHPNNLKLMNNIYHNKIHHKKAESEVRCAYCQKAFIKKNRVIRLRKKRHQRMFCSRKCIGKFFLNKGG